MQVEQAVLVFWFNFYLSHASLQIQETFNSKFPAVGARHLTSYVKCIFATVASANCWAQWKKTKSQKWKQQARPPVTLNSHQPWLLIILWPNEFQGFIWQQRGRMLLSFWWSNLKLTQKGFSERVLTVINLIRAGLCPVSALTTRIITQNILFKRPSGGGVSSSNFKAMSSFWNIYRRNM